MSDDFLKALEADGRERFAAESFEIDTGAFGSDSVPAERWRIQPLPSVARDKLISCLQNGEWYKGIATSLVHRAYRTEGQGRRFRPSDIDGLLKNPDFLDWVAEEIKFRADFDWLLDGADQAKKSSSETDG